MPKIIFSIAILLFFCFPLSLSAEVITADISWRGAVELNEDILVLAGVTLTIEPGTIVTVLPAENTRIDPEYVSHQTEILVRGKVVVKGKTENRVIFQARDEEEGSKWAGLIVDNGEVSLVNVTISGADTGINVLSGKAQLDNCRIANNQYGLIGVGPDTFLKVSSSVIEKNDYGIVNFNDAQIVLDEKAVVRENEKNNLFTATTQKASIERKKYAAPEGNSLTVTYKDEALPTGYTVWKGRVIIDGQLRVPPEGRLLIMPGTIVEFTKKDSNADGIGENGLQIQGLIIAKGTPEKPILFRSAEKNRQRGDWDSINILGSDLAQNIIEYCQVEDAYRGMHFHFSTVAVNRTILRNNYRGAQFQESLVNFSNSLFYDNKSAIQTRDSEVLFQNNKVFDNLNGANFFRLNLRAEDNVFANNILDGVRIREGTTLLHRNLLADNRSGLLVFDAVYGSFKSNVISENLGSGVLLRNTDNIELTGNAIQTNRVNGISLRDTRAIISNNLITDNGERGIGIVSFSGRIKNNNIGDNGLYAIGTEGTNDIDAADNWWGDSDLAKEIFDGDDEEGLGKITFAPQLKSPVTFEWPLPEIISNTNWTGLIQINHPLTVAKGADLLVKPGTKATFSKDTELLVYGKLKAKGTGRKRIIFTSKSESQTGDWFGIRLEHAVGSYFINCDFRYGEFGLHSHFVPMEITGCRFFKNDIGIRFRSGPIQLSKSLFIDNRIGIRAFRGNMNIFENEIRNNEIGIFIREGGKGVKIYRNNLHNNDRYSLRLGDFNKDNVEARNNWWGVSDPREKIFDGNQESYIGFVLFDPVLKSPINFMLNTLEN